MTFTSLLGCELGLFLFVLLVSLGFRPLLTRVLIALTMAALGWLAINCRLKLPWETRDSPGLGAASHFGAWSDY